MMKQLEVEELRACIGDAIREVQQGETIEVLVDGNVVALLVPALLDAAERREALAKLNALAEEIGKHVTWPTDVTQMLSEMRR
jgi:antitoxin (DNA-binding transcriptional repressor) of toxin-antitoxin stability system